MAIELVVLIRADARRDVVEHGRSNDGLRVRQRTTGPAGLERLGGVGAMNRLGRG